MLSIKTCHADCMDRDKHHRMPWHDVGCCIEGPAVHDLIQHFVQRYNTESAKTEHLPVSTI